MSGAHSVFQTRIAFSDSEGSRVMWMSLMIDMNISCILNDNATGAPWLPWGARPNACGQFEQIAPRRSFLWVWRQMPCRFDQGSQAKCGRPQTAEVSPEERVIPGAPSDPPAVW